MSIIVTNIRAQYGMCDDDIIAKAARSLSIKRTDIVSSGIYRESLDLRHGGISKLCSVELKLHSYADEEKLVQKNDFVYFRPTVEMPVCTGNQRLSASPVVVGFGPAGMFAALVLAENGFRPIVIERGASIEKRDQCVKAFFDKGKLDVCSNIQFGEGGAGTYSDGKLTTRINDPLCALILELLKNHGAPENTLRLAKPHIGTDLLKKVVVSIRKRIEQLGGKVYFNTKLTGIKILNGRLSAVITSCGVIPTEIAVLAIGHSARDTIAMLHENSFVIEPKAFSVGLRIEHLQEELNYSVYGRNIGIKGLPQAEYNLAAKPFDRGCYSFCMCPGGYVIAAASEEDGVVTNGMSMHSRSGKNANSAICVSVTPNDFSSSSPLSGIDFQRQLEHSAFIAGGTNYSAPVQTVGDFLSGTKGSIPKSVIPSYPIGYSLTDFSQWIPSFVTDSIKASLPIFAKKLSCFGNKDAVFTGIESRTSSPVRVLRGEDLYAVSTSGVIPCGEGAGYAGGIMSASVDGVRAASAILKKYKI